MNLFEFIARLAEDPELLARFQNDPESVLNEAEFSGLTDELKAALIADPSPDAETFKQLVLDEATRLFDVDVNFDPSSPDPICL